MKEIVYVAHPIGGDVLKNLLDLFRILRKLNLEHPDIAFIAPYVADIYSLNDHIPKERERGIDNDTALIATGCFTQCWLTGDVLSKGMMAESTLFASMGIPVIDKIGQL